MVGREEEIKILKRAFQSKYPEFIGIYGRRRVGKTFLITQTFAGKFAFHHAGLAPQEEDDIAEGSDATAKNVSAATRQLMHFHNSLVLQGDEETKIPQNWGEAFLRMIKLVEKKRNSNGEKIVIFLDELPWMDTPKSGFLSALEGLWNSWGCFQNDLLLVVSGSATSWMTDRLIENHGGLYGRLTAEIHLTPFTLTECKALFQENGVAISDYDIAQAHMVFGGIPFYLKQMQRGQSLAQFIDHCFFAPNAPLKHEFRRLFASTFTNPKIMETIVRALEQKRIGLTRTEIIKATDSKSGGTISDYLNALENSGFIVEYYPFGKGKREPYYRLVDPFCWFYLRFVDGQKSLSTDFWKESLDNQAVSIWRGLAFENLCFLHIKQIKQALGISGIRTEESAYIVQGSGGKEGAQIDLLISRADNVVDICEAKFYSSEVAVDGAMERKAVRNAILVQERLPKKAITHKVLLTTFGIVEGEYMWTFDNVITLKDLMR